MATAELLNQLPAFQTLDPATLEPQILSLLAENTQKLADITSAKGPFTWKNLMQPIEEMNDKLAKLWSPLSHLQSVVGSDAYRKAYNNILPSLTEYFTAYSFNEKLYEAIQQLANSDEFATLSAAQQKLISNELRDFKLGGIHLPKDKKAILGTYHQKLSQLSNKFSENIVDATSHWYLHTQDINDLAGLPEPALKLAMENANLRGLSGYVLTLDAPSYLTAIKFLDNRKLREEMYHAHSTRASDQGPNAGKWDNTQIINDILNLRYQEAKLLGFNHYAEYSLATKMAKNPDEVLNLLEDLGKHSKSLADAEYAEVEALAKEYGITKLEAWDFKYYSEKLRQKKYDFSAEDLRPYFPAHKALQGMFNLVNKLYGLTVKIVPNVPVWHPDVLFYELYDGNQQLRGGFYTDLYARKFKKDGAWMDECLTRRFLENGKLQLPVAYLNCNFMPPSQDKPALLTHDDVTTLFHEFGHCLHHILTKISYPGVNGTSVPWDAVEFPSQLMENFCWEKDILMELTEHYQTSEKLPDELYEKMMKAKHFQTGLQMIRQLEFALFDFRLHKEFDPTQENQVQHLLNEVRTYLNSTNVPAYNRFQHSFSHIFAGGYAAGYYGYKWSEILSADAYAKFVEHGVLDRKTGLAFMENILEVGGVRDPMESFIAFRGRKPTIDALLQQSGITA